MRAIDADELKTAFPIGEVVRTECVRATIDAQPTIEPEITQEDIELYCRRRCLTVITDELYNEMKMRWSAQPEYTDAEIQKMQDLEQAQIEKAYQLGYEEGRNEAQRWIPVSEDKPEPFQEVLVTLHENGWNGATYDTVKSWAYDGDYKITAWMPLPQPYKENKK